MEHQAGRGGSSASRGCIKGRGEGGGGEVAVGASKQERKRTSDDMPSSWHERGREKPTKCPLNKCAVKREQ